MFIEELELGVRAYNILKRHGVDTWADLAGVSVQDLNHWTEEGSPPSSIGPHAPIGLEGALQIAEAQRTIARAANPSHEWTDEQADLLAAAAVTAGHYSVVLGRGFQGSAVDRYLDEQDELATQARRPGETTHEWNCRMGLA